MSSLAFVLAPMLIVVTVLLQASARREGDRRADLARTRQVAWLVALIQIASAVVALTDGGLDPSGFSWLPGAGLDPMWRVEVIGALGLAMTATTLPDAMEGRSVASRLAIGVVHFAASALVAADDLGTLAVAVIMLSLGRQAWLSAAERELGGRARGQARASGRELIFAGSAAIVLALTAGAGYHSASRGTWSLRYDDLAQLSFHEGLQLQNLILLALALAPALALWPLGSVARALVHAGSGPYLRLVAPMAGSLALSRALPVLAPRVGPEFTWPALGIAVGGGALGLLASRGLDGRTKSMRAHIDAPVLVAAAWLPGQWAEYALCLGVLAFALRTAQGNHGPRAWVADASASAVPGTLGFAALAAVWLAMAESLQVLDAGASLVVGLGLGFLAWGRPRERAQGVEPRERWTGRVREYVAVVACFGLGALPHLWLPSVAPHAEARASEMLWRRCADVELADLRRPRLRKELSLGCSLPETEVRNYYEPPPLPPGAPDPTDLLVSSPEDAPVEARPFELKRRTPGVDLNGEGPSSDPMQPPPPSAPETKPGPGGAP